MWVLKYAILSGRHSWHKMLRHWISAEDPSVLFVSETRNKLQIGRFLARTEKQVTCKGISSYFKNLKFTLTEAFWYDVNRELLISQVKYFKNIQPSSYLLSINFLPAQTSHSLRFLKPPKPAPASALFFKKCVGTFQIASSSRLRVLMEASPRVMKKTRGMLRLLRVVEGNTTDCQGGTVGEAAMQRLDLGLGPPPSFLLNLHLRPSFPEIRMKNVESAYENYLF